MNKSISPFNCIFCGKNEHEAKALIVGPHIPGTDIIACICDGCAESAFFQANEYIAKKVGK